jgi:hypothetical protein
MEHELLKVFKAILNNTVSGRVSLHHAAWS